MLYGDYVFYSKSGHVLAEESLMADQVGEVAQKLARRHRTTVMITIIAGEPVAPDKCPDCGEVMPEIGPCWGCSFVEEADAEPKILTSN